MKQLTRIILLTSLMTMMLVLNVFAYIGNSNTGKFHYDDCRYVSRMAPYHQVYFNTRDEAINSGYVPCKVCRP